MRFPILVLLLLTSVAAQAEPGWSIDGPTDDIPAESAFGKVFGHDFELGSAQYGGAALELKSEKKIGAWPAASLLVFVDIEDGKRQWVVTPKSSGSPPHVHMKFAMESKDLPATLMFTEHYSMRLEIEAVTETLISGRIHLSLPDYRKSFIAGSFEAER